MHEIEVVEGDLNVRGHDWVRLHSTAPRWGRLGGFAGTPTAELVETPIGWVGTSYLMQPHRSLLVPRDHALEWAIREVELAESEGQASERWKPVAAQRSVGGGTDEWASRFPPHHVEMTGGKAYHYVETTDWHGNPMWLVIINGVLQLNSDASPLMLDDYDLDNFRFENWRESEARVGLMQTTSPEARAQANGPHDVEVELGALAEAYVAHSLLAARWHATHSPTDLTVKTAALDEGTPPGRAVTILAALAAACDRYTAIAGGDGVALVQAVLAKHFDGETTKHLLEPLRKVLANPQFRALSLGCIKCLPLPPPPTPAECGTFVAELAVGALGNDPHLDGMAGALEAVRASISAAGRNAAAPSVKPSLDALAAVLRRAMEAGYPAGALQFILETWREATNIAIKIEN